MKGLRNSDFFNRNSALTGFEQNGQDVNPFAESEYQFSDLVHGVRDQLLSIHQICRGDYWSRTKGVVKRTDEMVIATRLAVREESRRLGLSNKLPKDIYDPKNGKYVHLDSRCGTLYGTEQYAYMQEHCREWNEFSMIREKKHIIADTIEMLQGYFDNEKIMGPGNKNYDLFEAYLEEGFMDENDFLYDERFGYYARKNTENKLSTT